MSLTLVMDWKRKHLFYERPSVRFHVKSPCCTDKVNTKSHGQIQFTKPAPKIMLPPHPHHVIQNRCILIHVISQSYQPIIPDSSTCELENTFCLHYISISINNIMGNWCKAVCFLFSVVRAKGGKGKKSKTIVGKLLMKCYCLVCVGGRWMAVLGGVTKALESIAYVTVVGK